MILSGLRLDSAPCAAAGSRVAQHVGSDPEGMKAVVSGYRGRSSRRCRMPSSCRRWASPSFASLKRASAAPGSARRRTSSSIALGTAGAVGSRRRAIGVESLAQGRVVAVDYTVHAQRGRSALLVHQRSVQQPELAQTEAFGNAAMLVVADDEAQMLAVAESLEGNLTGCVYSAQDGSDDALYDKTIRQ